MITKDLKAYVVSNWSEFKSPITEISKSDIGVSLVKSPINIYNFDNICQTLYQGKNVPTSTDGIDVCGKAVELVEFKSGFKQRITKNNFDPAKCKCPDPNIDRVCEDYWQLFLKNQKVNIKALISSIRYKAFESYITLEKRVFPLCEDIDKPVALKLVVVIDADDVDSFEDTYSELAGDFDAAENSFSDIKKALLRLKIQQDAKGNDYYYDSIEVLSVQDYLNRLKLLAQTT